MYPKVSLVKETKKGGKKEIKITNTYEVHYICVLCRNKTQGSTLKTVKQQRMGGKGKEV
jgi:hypothetical protein